MLSFKDLSKKLGEKADGVSRMILPALFLIIVVAFSLGLLFGVILGVQIGKNMKSPDSVSSRFIPLMRPA